MEIDGLWCYLKKRRKLWIWKARNRNTGQLLDWEHESHDKVTIKRVIDRLAQWGVTVYCTDQRKGRSLQPEP